MDHKCSKMRKIEKCMLSVLTAVFLTAVLALSNFAGLFSKTVHATQSAVLSVVPDTTSAAPGDTITYTVKLGSVANLACFGFKLSIPDGLTFVEASMPDDLTTTLNISGTINPAFYSPTKTMAVNGANYTGTADVTLLTFTCTVDSGCTGEKTVSLYDIDMADTSPSVIAIPNSVNTTPVNTTTHTISFVANGGSGTMSNQTVYEGVSTQLNVVEFTRGGYEFTGWNTQADGSGARYSNQQAVRLTGDLNLYAQWTQAELISYTVTFKVSNGCWNDDTRNDKTVTYSRYSNEDLALTLQAGDIPAVGNKPAVGYSAGSWNNEPDTDTVLNGNVTYTYSYDRAVTASRADTNPKATPYTPTVNSLEITRKGCSLAGILSQSVRLGRQEQGPACQAVFRAHVPAGWHEAFTFNITLDDQASYSLKNGTLTFDIPEEFIKTGRSFALLGVDKNGVVTAFLDGDKDPNTISVYLDIEGYAFDLIYFD